MKKQLFAMALGAALTAAGPVQAAEIQASFSSLGGTDWKAALTLVNDGTPAVIQEFTVWFNHALYDHLAVAASPANWSSLVIAPDASLPADGFFDSVGQLGSGQRQSGFAVTFTYLGAGAPASLPFDIIDASFQPIVGAGGVTTPVPEPAVSVTLAAGLAGLALVGLRRRSGRSRQPSTHQEA